MLDSDIEKGGSNAGRSITFTFGLISLGKGMNPLIPPLAKGYYLPNPSARAGYDTRSIFKRSLTGLNSEFSFS